MKRWQCGKTFLRCIAMMCVMQQSVLNKVFTYVSYISDCILIHINVVALSES